MKLPKIRALGLLLAFFAASGLWQQAEAQQEPQFTLFRNNLSGINPAFISAHHYAEANTLYRKQWVGLEGSPTTMMFNGHVPFMNNQMAAGLNAYQHLTGPLEWLQLRANATYNLKLYTDMHLAFGLSAGVVQARLNPDKLEYLSQPVAQDPVLQQGTEPVRVPDLGAGLFFKFKKWEAGLSVPHLIEPDLPFGGGDLNLRSNSTLRRHVFMHGAYTWQWTDWLVWKPAAIGKVAEGAPVSADFQSLFELEEVFWAGANLRTSGEFSLLGGLNFYPGRSHKTHTGGGILRDHNLRDEHQYVLRIGYAFDFPDSDLDRLSGGSHEVMVTFQFSVAQRHDISDWGFRRRAGN